MTLKLHSAPGTCAPAIHIALEWLGQDHAVEQIDFATDEAAQGTAPKIDPATLSGRKAA